MKKGIVLIGIVIMFLVYACTKDKSKSPEPPSTLTAAAEAKNDSLATVAYNNKIKAITDKCSVAGCHTAAKVNGIGDYTNYLNIKKKIGVYSLAAYKGKALGIMSDCTEYECLSATEKTDLGTWLDTYFK
jgi:hypothetical protein